VVRLEQMERERQARLVEEIRKKEEDEALKARLSAAGLDAATVDAGGYDRDTLEKEMRDKAIKQREGEMRQRTEQAKRLDYLVRALREVERAKAEAAQASKAAADLAYVRERNAKALEAARAQHAAAMAHKEYLGKVAPYMGGVEDKVLSKRREAHEAARVREICGSVLHLWGVLCCWGVLLCCGAARVAAAVSMTVLLRECQQQLRLWSAPAVYVLLHY
jgi:translation initiation factor 3 subunit A